MLGRWEIHAPRRAAAAGSQCRRRAGAPHHRAQARGRGQRLAVDRRCGIRATGDRDVAPGPSAGRGLEGWTFFDRGLVDAAAALEHLTGEPILAALGQTHRYHMRVFLTPPWPEIYVTDDDRRHDLVDAIAEYERLCHSYDSLGYATVILPKVCDADRADMVLELLGLSDHQPHGHV